MIRERLASRLAVLAFATRLLRGLGARFVGLNILQSKRELVGIDALGSAAEPRPLKLFDDQLEPLDLAIAPIEAMSRTRRCSRSVSVGRLLRSSCMTNRTRTR
jgi:hypothetical protein